MNNSEIQVEEFLNTVETILKRIFEVDNLWIPLSLETTLVYGIGTECLDLSSIDFVELIVQIEELYDITYEFDIEINSIRDLYNYIVDSKSIIECNTYERLKDEEN